MRLLLVKTSSMGDVIHALAPLSDAARAIPGLVCDWLVEEAYADIPSWHPAVRRVIPCAVRRWRRAPWRTLAGGEWAAFRAGLRRESYDLVLDAQGLLKSAFLAGRARGPVAGRSFASAREGLASLFYDFRIPVDLGLSEVEQVRELFALALGYERPATPAEFGLDPQRFAPAAATAGAPPYAVFLHGAAWPSKLWPEDRWIALGQALRERGVAVRLPQGSADEQARARRIAAACGGEVLPPSGIGDLARHIGGARFVVGLDTGLTHLAIALGVRTVTLYGPSVPVFDRVARGELVNLCATGSKVVDTARPNTVPLERAREAVAKWL
jgi:heptosyltransferase I